MKNFSSLAVLAITVILCASVVCITNAQNFHLSSMDDISVKTSPNPGQAILTDFNNDGIQDLLVATTLYMGLGKGKFSSGHLLSSKSSRYAESTGDFNGDGNKDIGMILNRNRVALLFGDGHSGIDDLEYLTTPPGPQLLCVAAVDHNDKDDVLIACKRSSVLYIYLDSDLKNYKTDTLLGEPAAITVADFDKDGNNDIAVGFSDMDVVEVLTGDGTGVFKKLKIIPCDGAPTSIATADFDKNDFPDIIAGSQYSVMIAMNNRHGAFRDTIYTNYDLDRKGHAQASVIGVGDFNGDGYPDFAMSGLGSGGVYFCNNVNKGKSFDTAYSEIIGANLYDPNNGLENDFAVGDFNQDGFSDVALPSYSTSECIILINDHNEFKSYDYARFLKNGSNLSIGDFNEDGYADLAIYDANKADIFYGSRKGLSNDTLNTVPFFDNAGGETTDMGLTTADLDNDGHLDLIGGVDPLARPGNISVRLGRGNGTFKNIPIFSSSGDVNPVRFFSDDFNNDGNTDLLLCGNNFDDVTDVCLLLGKGDGSFKDPDLLNSRKYVVDIAPADYNNDHNLDFVVAYRASATGPYGMFVYLGEGDGSFNKVADISLDHQPFSMAGADFDNDGNADIMVSQYAYPLGPINYYKGLGDGTFEPVTEINTASLFSSWFMANDINEDGNMDLIAPADSSSSEGVGVLLGNGDGSFTERHYSCLVNTGAIGDMNGDGLLDFAGYLDNGAGIQIFLLYNTSTNPSPPACENDCEDAKNITRLNSISSFVFPNLFHTSASLKLPPDHNYQLQISDAAGRIVEAKNNVNGDIQFGESLLPGIYFVRIFSDKQLVQVMKAVKN